MTDADRAPDVLDDRLMEIEVKLAFLEERVATLSTALATETTAKLALAERVTLLERALQILAARVPNRQGEDVADANSDPVPHSG